jgi:hypothetical protein
MEHHFQDGTEPTILPHFCAIGIGLALALAHWWSA